MCAVKLNFVIEFVIWLRFNEVDSIKVQSKMFDKNRILEEKNHPNGRCVKKSFDSQHQKKCQGFLSFL